MSEENPMSDIEKQIDDHLINAVKLFRKLDKTHPSHNLDFVNGIHACQNVIIHRIVQRDYPNIFPTYPERNETSK